MFRSDLNLTIAAPRPSPNTICELPLHNPSPILISTMSTTTVRLHQLPPPLQPPSISASTAATRSVQPPPPQPPDLRSHHHPSFPPPLQTPLSVISASIAQVQSQFAVSP
nr:hypothetical protein Iba_chr03dCG1800 [Ipomoea batatas]